jgi:hypothetical protein
MLLALGAPLVLAAGRQRVVPAEAAALGEGGAWRIRTSSAITSRPMPPTREAVQVKYSSMTSWRRPTASNTCAPW